MITNYLTKHRQKVAITLFLVFYADLVAFCRAYSGTSISSAYVAGNAIEFNANLNFSNAKFSENFYSKAKAAPAKTTSSVLEADPVKRPSGKLTGKKKKDIGGPGQPEMQAFQSVNSNNMVDLFSGDFSYSIPLLDVGGYPVGLSYRGGASMDQEASWVGLGWNINPGTITRNVRGLPDDFNGTDSITKEVTTKPKWAAGVNLGFKPEIFGADLSKIIGGSLNLGIYYDNYTGPGFKASVNPSFDGGSFGKADKTYGVGEFSLGINFDSKSGFNVNPTYSVSLANAEKIWLAGQGSIGLNYNSRAGLQDLTLNATTRVSRTLDENKRYNTSVQAVGIPTFSSSINFNSPTFTPTISMPTTFAGFTFSARLGGELFGFHPLASIGGFYNQNFIAVNDRTRKMPAYGYLHMSRSVNDQKALLDFNREKDIPYRSNVPNIAIPFQTYDAFSISGEGIGGSFRAYRGDAGIVFDHQVRSRSASGNAGVDFGAGPNLVIAGADVRFTYAYTENKQWNGNNIIKNNLLYKQSDSTYEAVYFRNPGEQTSNTAAYYQSIGDDDVLRVDLKGNNYDPTASNYLSRFNKTRKTGVLQMSQPLIKVNRDKRSQVISYLNAGEASQVGLETEIRSYPVNTYPLGNCDTSLYEKIQRFDNTTRKYHHISEVTVLNADGRRYVYGIPAYNLVQKEATFSVNKSDAITGKGLVGYTANDMSSSNNKGKDGYFNMQATPAHAHSFLLTGLMSTDYVDVTGNGISEDDLGDAVKFNYTRMKWSGVTSFKWRSPNDEDKASYDEGLRTDNSDDKGHVVYGEKEIWYLNSIESKTMIATFKLDTDSLRKDGFEVKDIHGGRSTDATKRLMRLKEINLYSKADLKKNGANAKPIKTVHFSYSYRLCKGYPDLQDTTTGKLTLESVWFTYNGTKKGKKSPYKFTYGSNPDYKYKAYDRWGNYKPNTDNPSDIPSDEYPYAVKDSATAALNAGAWSLSEILLPSGSKMKIEYEADDYGYVQNRRANEMFQITGFGVTKDDAINSNHLYQDVFTDKRFVFVDVPVSVADKKDVWEKYLKGTGRLYFRLYTKMPGDAYGSGYEYVPIYAEMKDYGRINDNRIWIELQPSPEGNNKSPLATGALQFLRLNLPSKAYPGSDVRNDPAFKAAIMSVLSIVGETQRLLLGGFNNDARLRTKCKEVQLSNSFVRLASPAYKKYGGGYRVKRITISDNWQAMVGKKESIYGQEYRYTTTAVVNGVKETISSGVASYEPSIGNEENPFHQPVEYIEKATLAPSNFLFVEEPFGESLFPSAGVGYSKVRVSSINRKNIKSASGFEETEFYTAFDFPVITDRTQFDAESHKKGIDKFNLFNVRSRKYITLSQGFKIELNDMHGKMKSSAVFAETDSLHPITYTAQYYRSEKINGESFKLLNTVPVIDSANGKINEQGQIGKDIELVTDMREQYSAVKGAGARLNSDNFIMFIVPISIPTVFPEISTENSRYRSVSMLKVIQRYGIIDSVVHIDKGSKVSTRNLVWDGETGDVLLTQTQNEFNDPVYQFSYPAHWAFDGIGPAYKNIDAILHNVKISGGKIAEISGGQISTDIVNRIFQSGDEVIVLNKVGFQPGIGCVPPVTIGRPIRQSNEKKLWVVDKAKASGGAKELYFIDRKGDEYTGHNIDIRVIRSGRRNIVSSVGSIVSLKNPVKMVGPGKQIVIDSTIDVVSAGAFIMKDVWPVEGRFFKAQQCDSGIISVDTIIFPSINALVKREIYTVESSSGSVINQTIINSPFFTASSEVDVVNIMHTTRWERQTRGLVKFDLGFIPENATFSEANLRLRSRVPRELWTNVWSGHYWFTVQKAHRLSINESKLMRVIQPWDATTTLEQTDLITTTTDQVTLPASTDTCQNYSLIDIRNMVTAMHQQPSTNHGMLLKLSNPDLLQAVNPGDSVNHMSFCVPSQTGSTLGCALCSPMDLTLVYNYRKDSCYTLCKSVFDNPINPYVQGIWGNWRGWRNYVYYDRRKESDPLQQTNIRTQGGIKNFIPFWNMSASGISQTDNQYSWVWNSEITRYNQRGLETENHDPLGRFNSGLYGYSNTMPVAVTQNARHRETAFDGFEDYSFAVDSCITDCPTPGHFDFSAFKDSIATTQKHTGKASLRLSAGGSIVVSAKVAAGIDSLSPSVLVDTAMAGSCGYIENIKADSGAVYPGFTPLPGKLMNVSTWVKEEKDCKCAGYTGNNIEFSFFNNGSALNTVSVYPSGNIIEGWQRYDDTVRIPAGADSMTVKFRNTTNVAAYFDDFRFHPFNSNMKSFIYHPDNLRLLAGLDENNYASFYEYDDEGTLIRVKKETAKGIKTITETRSSLRKTD